MTNQRLKSRANFLGEQNPAFGSVKSASSALPWLSALFLGSALAAACASSEPDSRNVGRGGGSGIILPGTGGQFASSNGGGDGVIIGDNPTLPITTNGAFPAAPIFDSAAQPPIDPSEAGTFGDPATFSPGVCVFEPHLSDQNGEGALFPQNWLRPRFRWTAPDGPTLWEIRLHAPSQTNDLVMYTRSTQFAIPKEVWEGDPTKGLPGIRDNVFDPITVTIRGKGQSGIIGASGTFRVIPVLAGGAMVFWATEGSVVTKGSSRLLGFTVGDEAVAETLTAEQVTGVGGILQANGRDLRGESKSSSIAGIDPGVPRCIGCHSATPDGASVAFTDDYPWNQMLASVDQTTAGSVPTYVSAGAQELLKIPFLGASTMLPKQWKDGDRTLITTMGRRANYVYIDYGNKKEPEQHDLIWIDLQTTVSIPSSENLPAAEGAPGRPPWPDDFYSGSPRDEAMKARETAIVNAEDRGWGVLASEGGNSISNPSASHDGTRIAYAVSKSSIDGHPDWHNNTADIKILSLSAPRTAAGNAVPLMGASDPNVLEYYPAFSSDDAFIAFTRAPAPSNTSRVREGVDGQTNNPSGLGENPDGPYYNRKGEIYVVPSAGGTPHRLRANDPVACSGETSPGVINSWPKWSSTFRESGGKKYYFIIFSSARKYPGQFPLDRTSYTPPIETKSSQLYMGVLEVDAAGTLTSYPAVYLWNQEYLYTAGSQTAVPLKTSNLTPAWEDFTIPKVPPVIIPH